MNSKLANFFFRCFSTNSNVNGYEIEAIPICFMPSAMSQEIEETVEKIMMKKKENQLYNTSTEENLIDRLVYQLYSLTYDEVKIVDPETSITREEYEQNQY